MHKEVLTVGSFFNGHMEDSYKGITGKTRMEKKPDGPVQLTTSRQSWLGESAMWWFTLPEKRIRWH